MKVLGWRFSYGMHRQHCFVTMPHPAFPGHEKVSKLCGRNGRWIFMPFRRDDYSDQPSTDMGMVCKGCAEKWSKQGLTKGETYDN